jgi:hypothetical protein
MDTATVLSRREAMLRSVVTACLAGIALVQALGLPSLFVKGRQFGVLSMAAMTLCIALGWALAAAPTDSSRRLWRLVAATAVLVLAGWAVPRLFAVPGLAFQSDHQTTTLDGGSSLTPADASAALGAVCLVLSVVALRPARAALRALATAVAVLAAMSPAVAALLVAVGPGSLGGETALGTGAHHHGHASFENAIQFRPGDGGLHGSRFVVAITPQPHQSVFAVVLMVGLALLFVYGAVAYLLRRSAPGADVAIPGLEGRLA